VDLDFLDHVVLGLAPNKFILRRETKKKLVSALKGEARRSHISSRLHAYDRIDLFWLALAQMCQVPLPMMYVVTYLPGASDLRIVLRMTTVCCLVNMWRARVGHADVRFPGN